MDVSFLENQSYFAKNCLQGEKERKEENFWEMTSDPLPNPILSSPSLVFEKKKTQKQGAQDMENEGNLSWISPNIDGSQAGGEILQKEQIITEPEFLGHAWKRTQQKSKDLPTILPQNQSESMKKGPSSSSGNTDPNLVPSSSASTSKFWEEVWWR